MKPERELVVTSHNGDPEWVIVFSWKPRQDDRDDYPHWVNFIVFEVLGTGPDGIMLERRHHDGPDDIVNHPYRATRYIHGFVRWDGCSNWCFNERGCYILHFCGRDKAAGLGRLADAIYDFAESVCMIGMR